MKNFFLSVVSVDYLHGIALAVFGAFVRLSIQFKGRLSLRMVFSGILAASFVSMIFIELIRYYNLDAKLINLTSLLSGYTHSELLEIIPKRFLSKIKETGTTRK